MRNKNIRNVGITTALIAVIATAILILPSQSGIPIQQVVVYRPQSVAYDNFGAAIFAQGQMVEASKLPAGSRISFYIDTNKVGGPAGITSPGVRCSSTQASASYFQNTITMDKRFCADFNNAILDRTSVYGMVPDESVFLHKSNGERCYISGWGGGIYMINPASEFYMNYVVHRAAEKMDNFKTDILFLDDIQPGASNLNCGGASKEYPNYADYADQLIELAYYVYEHLPGYKVEANPANASGEWEKMTFLDGIMCENCFTDWGKAYPSASRMIYDLNILDTWIKTGKTIYIVSQPPNTSTASNQFIYAAALLVARGDHVYFHFGGDYDSFYAIPEYKYKLGNALGDYVCAGNICTRAFENGSVRVDFNSRIGSITLGAVTITPPTPTGTAAAGTPTATRTLSYTSTRTPTRTPTKTPTATSPSTPSATPASPSTVVFECVVVLDGSQPTDMQCSLQK